MGAQVATNLQVYCTQPMVALVICPELNDFENYEIESLESLVGCSTTILNNECFRYMPLPGFENAIDTMTVVYSNGINWTFINLVIEVSNSCEPTLLNSIKSGRIRVLNNNIEVGFNFEKAEVYNLQGGLIGGFIIDDNIDISDLQTGAYILVIKAQNGVQSLKFYKK